MNIARAASKLIAGRFHQRCKFGTANLPLCHEASAVYFIVQLMCGWRVHVEIAFVCTCRQKLKGSTAVLIEIAATE